MDRGSVESRIAELRAECAALASEVAASGRGLGPDDAFALAGSAQSLANSADGLVGALAAWGARVETTMTSAGPCERVHPVGFVDAMAPTELALAGGLTEGVAGRKVALGAALGERFPGVRALVLDGELPVATAHKVVDACAGLDVEACARVDAHVAPRLAGCDPARVATVVRRVATQVAADQVAAQVQRSRRTRTVEVSAGPDGLTSWWALLPAATSAAAWSAVDTLAQEYRSAADDLTLDQARADAFGDLLLRNVSVTAQVTLGLPVVSDSAIEAPPVTRRTRERVDLADTDLVPDPDTRELVPAGSLSPHDREALSWVDMPVDDGAYGAPVDPRYVEQAVAGGFTVSGTAIPGLGWVDAATVAALMATAGVEVARAVLDAGTGTLLSLTADAYRPPKRLAELVRTRDGTCRMWGCSRPAIRTDLDHTDPWPSGRTAGLNLACLCRRHHRMKQRGRWRPTLRPDGTLTWTDPNGVRRTTEPATRFDGPSAPGARRHGRGVRPAHRPR